MELMLQVMEKCDLLTISDGVSLGEPVRYAIGFADRTGIHIDYVQGDDLEALLKEVLERVS